MENLAPYLAVATIGTVSAHYLIQRLLSRSKLPLPPGPPSYPVIGQLLSMPSQQEGLGFLELSKAIGSDIISLNFFGTTIIALNSADAATDLFEKRGNIYSNRYATPMIVSPVGLDFGNMMTIMNPDDLWKRYKRVLNPVVNKQAVVSFAESQQREARLLLQRLLEHSDNLESSHTLDENFNRAMAATLLDAVYGYTLEPTNDKFVKDCGIFIDRLSLAFQPSSFLFNLMPWLAYVPEWVPGAGWKRVVRDWREHKEMTVDGMYKWTKGRVATGADDYSILASTLKDVEAWGWDEERVDTFVKHLGIVLYMGGTDSSTCILVIFVLAMILFPEAQKKAQQEIDTVIGANRLPNLNDRPSLPYVERLVSEVLRWQPVSPSGLPHVAAQEDIYRGYRIPKGAIIFGNVWAMSRDERVYSNPEMFDPDRFLNPAVPPLPIFGWGRRLCPGNHLAQPAIFIAIASMLAVFNISCPTDANGNQILPSTEPDDNGIHYHPMPFKCTLKPRSELHAELIRNGI